jgi:hypothetical protein
MKAVTLNLTDTQFAQLEQAAHALGASKSALAREVFSAADILAIGRRRLRELEALAPAKPTSRPARRRTLLNSEGTDRSRTRPLTTRAST